MNSWDHSRMHLKKRSGAQRNLKREAKKSLLREKSIWQQVIKESCFQKGFVISVVLPSLESPGFLYNHLIFSTQGEENVYRTKLRVQKHFPSLECHHLIIETCLIANSFCLKKFSSDLSSIHFSVLSSRQASGSNFSRLREMNFVNASNKGILSFPSFQI